MGNLRRNPERSVSLSSNIESRSLELLFSIKLIIFLTVLSLSACFAPRSKPKVKKHREDVPSQEKERPSITGSDDGLPEGDLFHFHEAMSDKEKALYLKERRRDLHNRAKELRKKRRSIIFEIIILKDFLKNLKKGSSAYSNVEYEIRFRQNLLDILSFQKGKD